MDNKEAETLYKEICNLIDGYRVPNLAKELASVKERVDQIYEDVDESEIDQGVYRMPSPWHAAILLIDQMNNFANFPLADETVSADIKTVDELGFIPAMHLLFRGQSNASFEPVPTLYREGVDIEREERAQAAFCLYLRHAFMKVIQMSLQAWVFQAAARHYEIKTALLDLSADPTVSVYFAATGKKHSDDQEAVVYVYPLPQVIEKNGKFLFPPPFAKRLYLQKGVFVWIPKAQDGDKSKNALKPIMQVRFPLDPSFCVVRGGKPIDIFPDDQWLSKVKAWAEKLADQGVDLSIGNPTEQLISELNEKLDEYLAELPPPPEFSREYAKDIANEWLDCCMDMFVRLTHFETSTGTKLNPTSLKVTVQDNDRLMKSIADYAVYQAELQAQKHPRPNYLDQIAQHINAALAEFRD